ncbi:MAG: hypothetical protein ACQCN6_03610 [Candidatus Bathyarchaeia archaeon]
MGLNQKLAALVIIMLAFSLLVVYPPPVAAQPGNTVNLQLSFHNYALLVHDSNNSLYVYDGADGAAPNQAAATQTTVDSQISGERSGFAYWSAVVIWAAKLPMDLHVKGNVEVHAYISSTFKLSGLFSGGGYAMGLVDIDENNNEVKEFLTEAPYTIGANPFTATPSQYSQSVNVDYVFQKGHYLGFVVGLGATSQGFSATVYFGSQERNSGATLPVVDTMTMQTFTVAGQAISVASDSAVTNFHYDSSGHSLSFNAQMILATTGTCTVTVPKTLMQVPFIAASGTQPLTLATQENATHYQLSFTHSRSTEVIEITGSAPAPTTTSSATSTQTTSPSHAITGTSTPSPSVPEMGAIAVSILVVVLATVFAITAILKKQRATQ